MYLMATKKKLIDTEFIQSYVADRLDEAVREKNMTLAEIAEKIWFTTSYVFNVLRGKNATLNYEIYLKIAGAIGLSENNLQSFINEAGFKALDYSKEKSDHDNDPEYALKSLVGDDPRAHQEAKMFIDYLKNKYPE